MVVCVSVSSYLVKYRIKFQLVVLLELLFLTDLSHRLITLYATVRLILCDENSENLNNEGPLVFLNRIIGSYIYLTACVHVLF